MPAAKPIPDHVKIAVVQALACCDGIAAVAERIKIDYGIALSPQAIEAHDPTKSAGRRLAPRWRTLFEETRARFITDTSAIPIAHKAVRLRALHRMAAGAEAKGNFPLAAALLRQAAEEVGNIYTNRREFTGQGGKYLPSPAVLPAVAIFALPDSGRDTHPGADR